MTGPQLEPLLFPKTLNSKYNGLKSAFGRYLEEKAGYKTGRQTVNKLVREENPPKKILAHFAAFRGYKKPDEFVKWALSEQTDLPYSEESIQNDYQDENSIQNSATNHVNDDVVAYKKNKPQNTIKSRLIEVMQENVSLHKALASRGEMVIELLDKTWTDNPEKP